VIKYISEVVSNEDTDSKQEICLMWDDLLDGVNKLPDKQRLVFDQAMSEVLASFENEERTIDKELFCILINNLLIIRKQKIEVFFNENGDLSISLVNIESDDKNAEIGKE
jgi:hypothetical protein